MSTARYSPTVGPTPEAATREPSHTTRARLLDAAEQLFAEQGFPDTSVRAITRAAGANLAAVNYHFGNKENLYAEVFRRRLVELREHRIRSVRAAMTRPDAQLEDVIEAFCRSFVEPLQDPHKGRIMCHLYSREMMQPRLPKGMIFVEMIDPIRGMMREAFARVCPEMDEHTALLGLHGLVGQLLHFLQTAQMHADNERDDNPFSDMRNWLEHTVRFNAAGLRATVAEHAAAESTAHARKARDGKRPARKGKTQS